MDNQGREESIEPQSSSLKRLQQPKQERGQRIPALSLTE
jgi:hypothetical protein